MVYDFLEGQDNNILKRPSCHPDTVAPVTLYIHPTVFSSHTGILCFNCLPHELAHTLHRVKGFWLFCSLLHARCVAGGH